MSAEEDGKGQRGRARSGGSPSVETPSIGQGDRGQGNRGQGRRSRKTVPIDVEDLRQLIGDSTAAPGRGSSATRPTPAGLPAVTADVRLDDPTPMTAEQEFGAGGSISEALSTVTDGQHGAPDEPGAASIGDLEARPQLLVPLQEITWHKLDHQAGFVLSRIDGTLTYSELLTICGMPEDQARDILAQLVELKLIGPAA